MSNTSVTYLVGACAASSAWSRSARSCSPRRSRLPADLERAAAVVLSLYVLAAFVGVGVVLGALIIVEWPRVF